MAGMSAAGSIEASGRLRDDRPDRVRECHPGQGHDDHRHDEQDGGNDGAWNLHAHQWQPGPGDGGA